MTGYKLFQDMPCPSAAVEKGYELGIFREGAGVWVKTKQPRIWNSVRLTRTSSQDPYLQLGKKLIPSGENPSHA